MKSIEVSARTIEDAISDGLKQLDCSISDCKVEILQEGAKGLFGFFGSKPAAVRLTLNAEDGAEVDKIDLGSVMTEKQGRAPKPKVEKKPVERKPVAEKKPAAEKAPQPARAQEKGKMRFASNPQVVDKPAASNNDVLERFRNAPLPGSEQEQTPAAPKAAKERRAPRERKPREERAPREDRMPREDRPPQERTPVPAPENIVIHSPESLEGIAQIFLLDVTQRMGVDVQVDVQRGEDGHLFIAMYGDTLGILIGRRGETLDALQYLTSLQVNRGREDYTRVTLDTENYRAKREEALTKLAARMASRAIKTGRKVSLEPMNPYERRILHASLQGNPGITTHSEGDEPYRHVVLVPVKEPTKEA